MPQGSKSKYTAKQKRQARHIAASAKQRGASTKRAAQIGYATVNKQDHGGKKAGSGRGKARNEASSRAGGKASHGGGRSLKTGSRTRHKTASHRKATASKRGGSRAAHARAGRAAHRT